MNNYIKTYSPEPGGGIQLESIPPEAKDAALGRYMDAFSRLEGCIHLTIASVMQIEFHELRSVFAVLATKPAIDLLTAVAHQKLNEESAQCVKKICKRLRDSNMRRNHIVHGRWEQVAIATDQGITQQWVRTYQHPSPSLNGLVYTDAKMKEMYTFTIPELHKATTDVEEVLQEVCNLRCDADSRRA